MSHPAEVSAKMLTFLRELDGPDSRVGPRQRIVKTVGGIMAMRTEERQHEPAKAARVGVGVAMRVLRVGLAVLVCSV